VFGQASDPKITTFSLMEGTCFSLTELLNLNRLSPATPSVARRQLTSGRCSYLPSLWDIKSPESEFLSFPFFITSFYPWCLHHLSTQYDYREEENTLKYLHGSAPLPMSTQAGGGISQRFHYKK